MDWMSSEVENIDCNSLRDKKKKLFPLSASSWIVIKKKLKIPIFPCKCPRWFLSFFSFFGVYCFRSETSTSSTVYYRHTQWVTQQQFMTKLTLRCTVDPIKINSHNVHPCKPQICWELTCFHGELSVSLVSGLCCDNAVLIVWLHQVRCHALTVAETQSLTVVIGLAALLPTCNCSTISSSSRQESQVINMSCERDTTRVVQM